MRDRIYIIGGGTVFHIRPHLALSAPAYGQTAWDILQEIEFAGYRGEVHLFTTRMAGDTYEAIEFGEHQRRPLVDGDEDGPGLETNNDIWSLISEKILPDPRAGILFLPAALCDFEATVLGPPHVEHDEDITVTTREMTASGKRQPRLHSREDHLVRLMTAPKIISRIRKERKDLFLVGFKSTTGATPEQQFEAGLGLLKRSSCNLVLANDLHTRLNMIVTPEQASYCVTEDRDDALNQLVQMALWRSKGTFTRSHVLGDDFVPWSSDQIPQSLKTVVEHCIKRGAYKPFLGKTVGHFAVKRDDKTFLTSPRGRDFNQLPDPHAGFGMVQCSTANIPGSLMSENDITVYGGKPSVGGMSQRIIFANHPTVDCIVHFHCPLRPGFEKFRVRSQFEHECGSHECGKNTSDGLELWYTDKEGNQIKAVMLDKHGPNIVFSRNVNPQKVIEFIERYWDLERSTSEVVMDEPRIGAVTGRWSMAR